MSDLTLVSHNLCPYVQRALITLAEKSIPHHRVYVSLADKPAWFTEISPLGKVPLLRVGDEVLFESSVICEYLDETTPGSLHPQTPLERARHRAWIEYASTILNGIVGLYNARDAAEFADHGARLSDRFAWLERHLGPGPYFADDAFSLVDAAFGPTFRYFDTFESACGIRILDAFPKVGRWRRALMSRPSVSQAVDAGYGDRLEDFLRQRMSHISTLVSGRDVSRASR